MNTHPLLVEVAADGDVPVLRLTRAILSTPAAEALCDALHRLAGQSGKRRLRLDFSCVEYLSGPGLSKLLDLHAHLRASGGGLVVSNAEGCLALARLSGVRDAYRVAMARPA